MSTRLVPMPMEDQVRELRAQLAAVEKERDYYKDTEEPLLKVIHEITDQRDELEEALKLSREFLADSVATENAANERVKALEAALESTVATHACIAGFIGGAHAMPVARQILAALRDRAGLTKEGT